MRVQSVSFLAGSSSDEAQDKTAHKQIAMATRRDYRPLDPTFTPLDVIGRAAVSLAREVQIVRAQVTLQPGQKGTKKLRDR